MYLTAQQIRAARAMLNWSQEDFGKAVGLCGKTIRGFEMGNITPRRAVYAKIRKTLEAEGLQFTEDGGVCPRPAGKFRIYDGSNSCENFYNDMLRTVGEKGGGIECRLDSQEHLMHSCGIASRKNLRLLEQLSDLAPVKCLLFQVPDSPLVIPAFEFKVIPKTSDTMFFYIYGDKFTIVSFDRNKGDFQYVILQSADFAQERRDDFYKLWNNGVPLFAPQVADMSEPYRACA